MNSKKLMFIKSKNTSTYLQVMGKKTKKKQDKIQFNIQSQQDSRLYHGGKVTVSRGDYLEATERVF